MSLCRTNCPNKNQEMRRAASQTLMRHDEDEKGQQTRIRGKEALREVDSIAKQVTCLSLHKRQHRKPCDELRSMANYGSWRVIQLSGASRIKKLLKATESLQSLIDEHLFHYQLHYNRSARTGTKISDLASLLMPKWAPAQEQAAIFWLGDWRPSAVLQLLVSLTHTLTDPVRAEQALPQLIHDVRIEEAVIDEEMSEIQSNCIFHLPFGPVKNNGTKPALARIRSEFKKIHGVAVKAQNLRAKTFELAVKKMLTQTDAAKFLVAFAEIHEELHDFAVKYQIRKGQILISELED